jgi:hypothetical protein
MVPVLRAWTFWIHAFRQEECREDMERMVFGRMRQASGNQHANALFRDAGDGTVEVIVLSVWDSIEHVKAFAGPDYLQPMIPPSHLGRVFDREPSVHHFAMTDLPPALQGCWLGRPAPVSLVAED